MLYDNMITTISDTLPTSSAALQKALRFGIAAIKKEEERNCPKPLTREELENMNGKPVYIYRLTDNDGHWEVAYLVGPIGLYTNHAQFLNRWDQKGRTWDAYQFEPKRCPNCGTLHANHEVFPRVCSYCGAYIDEEPRAVDEFESMTPLTEEEVRNMGRKPIYVRDLRTGEAHWSLIFYKYNEGVKLAKEDTLVFAEMGSSWLAYPHEPGMDVPTEEKTNHSPICKNNFSSMIGKPVYIIRSGSGMSYWDIINGVNIDGISLRSAGELTFENMGDNWLGFTHEVIIENDPNVCPMCGAHIDLEPEEQNSSELIYSTRKWSCDICSNTGRAVLVAEENVFLKHDVDK